MPNQIHIVCTRSINPRLKLEASGNGIIIHDDEFLKITYSDQPGIAEILDANQHPLVFTSSKGVDAVAYQIRKHKISMKNKFFYGIHGKTIVLAKQNGFIPIDDAKDAESLAHVIISRDEHAVIHCTSNLNRPILYHLLQQAGVRMVVCEVYHKELIPLKVSRADGIMFFSPSQIDAYLLANDLHSNTPAFCIGSTTAFHLSTLEHKNIITASQSNEAAMMQKVYNHYSAI